MFGVEAFPGGGVLLPAVPDAAQPPLAGVAGPRRRGPSRARPTGHRHRQRRGGDRRDPGVARPGAPQPARSRSSARPICKPILLAVAIAAFNQLSGINALMYYAPHIFKMAGAGEDSALLQTVAVGGDEPGVHDGGAGGHRPLRPKKLMLVGSIGYILSLGARPGRSTPTATEFTTRRQHRRAGQPAGLHRLARLRPGGRDLGLHQRDLPQPRARPRPGAGQFHALVHGGGDLLDVSDDRRTVWAGTRSPSTPP